MIEQAPPEFGRTVTARNELAAALGFEPASSTGQASEPLTLRAAPALRRSFQAKAQVDAAGGTRPGVPMLRLSGR